MQGTTYYVLDAQGKSPSADGRRRQAGELAPLLGGTMAVYLHANDDVNHVITFAQTEKHIYGSSRLGINNKSVSMFGSQNATYSMRNIRHYMGKRTYELNNHLGNVLSIISDKVIPHNNGGTPDYWLADIRQATDYSPFGVILKSRDIPLTAGTGGVPYRYAFNGMEMDNEIHPGSTGTAKGDSYDFGSRMLDPRIGRWLTIDPQWSNQPSFSPYKAFLNSPIIFNDPDGEDEFLTTIYKDANGNITKRVVSDKAISHKVRAGNIKCTAEGKKYRNYYDFRTVVTITTGADGTTTEEITHYTLIKSQRARTMMVTWEWLPNVKVGDIVGGHMVMKKLEFSDPGGIIVWGSGSGNEDSPGRKTKGKIWFSIDFTKFSETVSLAITAASSRGDNTLDGDFDGTKAVDMADKAKEITERDDAPILKPKPASNPSVDTIWFREGKGYEIDPNSAPVNPKQNEKNKQEYINKHGKPQ